MKINEYEEAENWKKVIEQNECDNEDQMTLLQLIGLVIGCVMFFGLLYYACAIESATRVF